MPVEDILVEEVFAEDFTIDTPPPEEFYVVEVGPPGPAPVHEWSGTSLRLQLPTGVWGALVDLKGDPGGVVSWAGKIGIVTPAISDVPGLQAAIDAKLGATATAASAAKLAVVRTIGASGDISWSVSFDGSGSVSAAATLPNVNASVGTFTKLTVNAKGQVTAATTLVVSDIPTLTSSKISDFDTQVRTSRLDQMAAPIAAVTFNGQRATGLADPTASQDAATKAYVDAVAQGLDPKASVRLASNTNHTLSGLQTVDGVSAVAGDRVLLRAQTSAAENGIWVVAAGAWARAIDANTSAKVTPGLFVFVEEGSANADSAWVLTTDAPVTLGTTALTFAQFASAGQITAGNGLTKTGNVLSVLSAGARITVSASGVDLQSSVATPGAYTKVTVDTYGRVVGVASIASSDVTSALGYTPESTSNKGQAGGYASLGSDGKLTANQRASSLRNLIVNGNFQLNTRGTATPATLLAGARGHDCWKAGTSGCTLSWTGNTVDATVTITAGTYLQIIEGANIEGGSITVSWAGTAQCRLNGGSWFNSPGTGTFTAGSDLTVEFGTGTVGQVMTEPGTVAHSFERRSFVEERLLAARYIVPWAMAWQGYAQTSLEQKSAWNSFFVPMRTTPSVTVTSQSNSARYPSSSWTTFNITANGFGGLYSAQSVGGNEGWQASGYASAEL